MKKFFASRGKNARKRRGASLVEMVLAILVLAVVLLGLLGGIAIARGSLLVKERETARQIALTVLEDLESVPYDDIDDRIGELDGERVGDFVVRFHNRVPGDKGLEYSVIVTVDILLGSTGGTKSVTMGREVSASAWRNVGEFPDD